MVQKIIFDTDIGFDCDDAGALALLHRLCDKKEAELLAVTACYDSPYVAGCVDAINRYYGRTVPVGMLYGTQKAVDDLPVYSPTLCTQFPNQYYGKKNSRTRCFFTTQNFGSGRKPQHYPCHHRQSRYCLRTFTKQC